MQPSVQVDDTTTTTTATIKQAAQVLGYSSYPMTIVTGSWKLFKMLIMTIIRPDKKITNIKQVIHEYSSGPRTIAMGSWKLFTMIITTHFRKMRELYNLLSYLKLYVEEDFIINNFFMISLTFVSLVHTRSGLKARARRKLRRIKENIESAEAKGKCSRRRTVTPSIKMRMYRLQKEHHDVYYDNEFQGIGIPLPDCYTKVTPSVIAYFIVNLGSYSILALPGMQLLFILFAPLWIMALIFLIPPLLISYLILCLLWSIVPFYVKNFDLDCGYSVNGLENNCIIN